MYGQTLFCDYLHTESLPRDSVDGKTLSHFAKEFAEKHLENLPHWEGRAFFLAERRRPDFFFFFFFFT